MRWSGSLFNPASGIHRGEGENQHAHLMISERRLDRHDRSAEQWFWLYNGRVRRRGGQRRAFLIPIRGNKLGSGRFGELLLRKIAPNVTCPRLLVHFLC